MVAAPQHQNSYMPQLDGLRAFAVGSVVAAHWISPQYLYDFPWGDAGVQLFFVLSGFLITGILLRCRGTSNWRQAAWAFYARRFLRIFPLFYAVLAVTYALDVAPMRESMWWHVAYLSNFYFMWHGDWHGSVSHFWSLAVEEQFYLFWPAVMLCVPERRLVAALVATIATGVLSRFALPFCFPHVELITVLPIANFDALGLGGMLAFVASGRMSSRLPRLCALGIPSLVLLVALRESGATFPLQGACQHLAMLLAFTWLVGAASTGLGGVAGGVLEFSPIRYLGRISYGVYILHNFAPVAVLHLSTAWGVPSIASGIPSLALMAVLTLATAGVSWRFFESPINSFKDRFPYQRQKGRTVVTLQGGDCRPLTAKFAPRDVGRH
jgi:peptidoglycan/LPS O-acetylase OafA/YrhL